MTETVCWNQLHAAPRGYCPYCMTAWDREEPILIEHARVEFEAELKRLDAEIDKALEELEAERKQEPRNVLLVARVKRRLNLLRSQRTKKAGTRK